MNSTRNVRSWLVVSALALAGCQQDAATNVDPQAPAPERVLRPRSQPIEFVGMRVKRKVDLERFLAFVSPIFGDEARAGRGHVAYELQPGLFLSVEPDARTAEQVILRVDMSPSAETESRTVMRVPVSFAYGSIYVDAVKVALATAEKNLASKGEMAPFHLDYTARSARGGRLLLRLDFADGITSLVFEIENPQTSLSSGAVNQPAFDGDPYETLGGTVWFELARSEFDFFSTRAYGITPGFRQNFSDFQLLPHEWLRLTVNPLLSQNMVDVNFDVVTLDGRRIPLARAPASLLAGEQFQKNVLRLVDNMMEQEAAEPGSSDEWVAPFHYDDPAGGGVVEVIAQGAGGKFRIAYTVESPVNLLRDVDFVDYRGKVDVPTDIPDKVTSCEELGSTRAPVGRFLLKFRASTTVINDRNRDGSLGGRVVGAIYRAEDVTIQGPNDGAVPVAEFDYADVEMDGAVSKESFEIPVDLAAGSYQILGFMDIDGNASPESPEPDVNDPVFIPIGAYALECARHPVEVEFAILLPPGL
ncbi:hypothetical protein L6R52_22990 [Myxococcota bacterium]|nr:hypothetical protein [Myxococcota bacterium]